MFFFWTTCINGLCFWMRLPWSSDAKGSTSKGGSLAGISLNSLPFTQLDFHSTKTFEYMDLKVSSNCPLIIKFIYRPPKKKKEFFLRTQWTTNTDWCPRSFCLVTLTSMLTLFALTALTKKTVLDCVDLFRISISQLLLMVIRLI